MDQICIEPEVQYALSKQICKCLKFRALVMNIVNIIIILHYMLDNQVYLVIIIFSKQHLKETNTNSGRQVHTRILFSKLIMRQC
jgi:hypothetical protein